VAGRVRGREGRVCVCNPPDERRGFLVQAATLARYAAPTAFVAGALMIITRPVILFTTPAEVGGLEEYVLGTTHAINSVVSILAFALLVIALVALYDREAPSAGAFGALSFGAAVVGTMFMTGDWWYEAFAVPRLADVAPDAIDTFVGGRLLIGGVTSFLLFGIGWTMYGAASIRAHVIPRNISITIVVGGLMSGVPIGLVYLSGGVVLGLAFVWLSAWMRRAATLGRVSRVATAG
jgi:hypothetical protein